MCGHSQWKKMRRNCEASDVAGIVDSVEAKQCDNDAQTNMWIRVVIWKKVICAGRFGQFV